MTREPDGDKRRRGALKTAPPAVSSEENLYAPIIRTKLAPPRVGGSPVPRNAALELLEAGRERKLTLVVGPAGSGKTMLLTQWRKALVTRGVLVSWYNVGQDDDDTAFAQYLVEALHASGLSLSGSELQLFARSRGRAWKPLLAGLVNALSEFDRELYLIVDDFHYINSFNLLRFVDRWLALTPANFHLVLGTRIRPPLNLPRLRAEDQLSELDFADLRFTLTETSSFVSARSLPELSPGQIRQLHDITDGWAAGLQLLAFSLRKETSANAFFARQRALNLSQESALHRYLDREVLDHLSKDELEFLTRISACRRFNRELSELLTANHHAHSYLTKFDAESLFLLPIDTADPEPWYRFHRLFAVYLNQRLSRYDAREVQKIHQLAGRWFAGKNLPVEALRHARLGGDDLFVVELMDRYARRMLNSANFLELLHWAEFVPLERMSGHLNLCLCVAWAELSCSRLQDFDRLMANIEHVAATALPELRTEVQLLKAYRAMQQDDSAAALRIVQPLFEEPPPDNALQAQILSHVGSLALIYANDFEGARELVRTRQRPASADRPGYQRPLLDVVIGFSFLLEGHINQAWAALQPLMRDTERRSGDVDVAGLFGGYFLEACYQAGELEHIREYLERYSDAIESVGATDAVLFASRVIARLRQLDGEHQRACEAVQRLEEIGYRNGLDRLIAWSLYEQVLLAVRGDSLAAVPELIRRLGLLAERYPATAQCVFSEVPLCLHLARACVAAHTLEDGWTSRLNEAEHLARALRRGLLVTQIMLQRAVALERLQRHDEAMPIARAAVRTAREHGMARLVPDLGIRDTLLMLLPQGSAEHDFVRGTCSDPGAPVETDSQFRNGMPTTELLSARELEVINLLSRALSTKGIAKVLNLSSGTVKWHLKNVYSKLDAGSREDALAKARALNILPGHAPNSGPPTR